MISDQEIKDYFKEVIKPMFEGVHIVSDFYCQSVIQFSQKITTIELLEKKIYELLINIGVEKRRISFLFDGYNFTVNIKHSREIRLLYIDCDISFKL